MTHAKATYLILAVNAAFTFAVFYFQWFGIIGLMLFNVIIGGILLLIPSYLVSKRKLIKPNDPYQEIILFKHDQVNGHSLNGSDTKTANKIPSKSAAEIVPLKKLKEQIQKIGLW